MDELTLLRADDFPARLREIPDRPKQLYLRGNLPSSEKKWLCVVGSRAASAYGKQVLHYLIEGLRGYPVVIVSGLAFGIDAEAHHAALDASLDIVAVPGSGLDWNVVYPRAHVSLAREILEAGGALLSEESPEARTMDYMFPKRNRVMVGLSDATLVIETVDVFGGASILFVEIVLRGCCCFRRRLGLGLGQFAIVGLVEGDALFGDFHEEDPAMAEALVHLLE